MPSPMFFHETWHGLVNITSRYTTNYPNTIMPTCSEIKHKETRIAQIGPVEMASGIATGTGHRERIRENIAGIVEKYGRKWKKL